MKKIFDQKLNLDFRKMLFAIFILYLSHFSTVIAQNCKPDFSQKDKIENKQIDGWYAKLYETSFGSSMLKTSDVDIDGFIGREGNSNFVELHLIKRERSDENAVLESQFKGAKGDEFAFGLKDGDPLKFAVTDVNNSTTREKLTGNLITTVILTSEVKDEDIRVLKEALTTKPITAVRIKLENDLTIEKSVKDKNANKMMDKANCFFSYLQDKGYMK
jgi:hypothetical protein